MNAIVLKSGREKSVLRRHPWIFSGAIAEGSAGVGETVAVKASDGTLLGYGWYSPESQIRVRMLTFGAAAVPGDALLASMVADSVNRRMEFRSSFGSDSVRLINAENDGLPGVVADMYAGWVVCQFTSAGGDANRDAIVRALMASVPNCRGVSERRDLKDRQKEGLGIEPRWLNLAGDEPPERISMDEGVCKFLVDVRNGHKTGFYLDQRKARRVVGELSGGADVLNCFSYTGGFGLYARANGAKSVVQVDISEDAIGLARSNELMQPPSDCEMTYVVADVFKFLRKCRDEDRSFDMIVLDPPKFASVRSQVMQAARGYKDINLLAMKLLRPNGVLATFSCSGAMTSELFDKVLAEAASDAGVGLQIVCRTQADRDHPVSVGFPEGSYLKGVVLKRIS